MGIVFLWNFHMFWGGPLLKLLYEYKSANKISYGFRNLVKVGVEIINLKNTIGRTIFSFSCKTSKVTKWFFLFLVNFLSFFHSKLLFFERLGGHFE